MSKKSFTPYDILIDFIKQHGIGLLRISLAIVYVWFGLLKVFGVSPVASLVSHTYPSFPEPFFLIFLGVWEVLIGIGLFFKLFMTATLLLLFLQMGGIFCGVFLSPSWYIMNGNPLLLTTQGEFVVKNFVLLAASMIVGEKYLSHKRTKAS